VLPELIVALIVVAFDSGVLDRPVHPLDLTIGPRVPRLGQPMVDIVLSAGVLVGPDADAAGRWLPHAQDARVRP
jgi:hypothetical protein